MANLGIDAGATATKWSLVESSIEVSSGTLPAMDAHLYRESSKIRFVENFTKLKSEVTLPIENIVLGITGLSEKKYIKDEINKYFNSKVQILSDIELAYRANFINESGILLYAGTGSVAISIDPNSQEIKVGGWGYLLGDEGAGYWIGREVIRHALFSLEKGDLQANGIESAALTEIGAEDWNSVKQFVYSKERSDIAKLANLVSQYADQGDKKAIEILENAAGYLADLVNRIDDKLDNKMTKIIFAGGVSKSKKVSEYLSHEFEGRFACGKADIARSAAELAAL